LNREACERFLEGSKGDVEDAEQVLRKHLEWRESYNVDTITDEDFTSLSEHGWVFFGLVFRNKI
jgi:hypothetical protein